MGKIDNFNTEFVKPKISKKELIAKLSELVNSNSLLHEKEDLKPFECDGLSAYPKIPLAAVLPENEKQIQEILKVCFKNKVPIVFRGSGTSLSGGAIPYEHGLLLVLTKLNKIIKVDNETRTATVQPGVRNLSVSEAASKYNLYYAPDPSSQIACSIGGNIAENSGGVHCLKYGLTVHNILSIRFLTIEGEIIEVGSQSFDSPGYDILALMTGSEGLLGVITEVTLKLLPKPKDVKVILASFDCVKKAGEAVSNIISRGVVPAGLEMMDKKATEAVEQFVHAGYPLDAEAILLCESDGDQLEVEKEIKKISQILKDSCATSIRIAKDENERTKFWAGRKSAFPAVGRILPDYFCMDGTIPKKELPFVLDEISKLSKKYNLQCANVFHAGDGNLHPLIMFDANLDNQLERAEKFGAEILELCVKVGGTITGEHGVGIEKINQMCVQFDHNEIRTFHNIKIAFDEFGLLNPGKAIPTLNRCAEFGAMHVHKGDIKFPDIPRF